MVITKYHILPQGYGRNYSLQNVTGPHNTIANESHCWSRVQEFHTFLKIDQEIFSTVILLLPLIQEGLVSVTNKSMCTKYW